MKFINVGFGNLVSENKIVAIVSADSAPIKRIIQESKERKSLIDATFGRKTQSVIFTDSTTVVISALTPDKIAEQAEDKG